MNYTSNEILTVIIAVIVILVFIALFVLVMLIYFNNRKLQGIREIDRMKQDYEQALLQTQLEVQAQTMRQISQEIHDNIGQILSLVNLNLQTLKAGEVEKINNTSVLVNKAITDLRNLSKSLNPENIAKKGLIELVKQEMNLLENTGKFSTQLQVAHEVSLPSDKLIILYRMLQEVLNNIIKHSDATNVTVNIDKQKLVISDNGKGFLYGIQSTGLGLQNLQQRARVIGASVDIKTAVREGTIITFNIENT